MLQFLEKLLTNATFTFILKSIYAEKYFLAIFPIDHEEWKNITMKEVLQREYGTF